MNTRKRLLLSAPLAVGLAVALSSQALGASWSAPAVLDAAGSTVGGTVVVEPSTVVVAYTGTNNAFVRHAFVRRSVDGGATWGARVRISGRQTGWGVDETDIAAHGQQVDVVWNQPADLWGTRGRINYARSTDGGATFGRPKVLRELTWPYGEGSVGRPAVAHGADGLVVVAWAEFIQDPQGRQIVVRTSHNDGATFGPVTTIPVDPMWGYVAVAMGDGVIYLAALGTTSSPLAAGVLLFRSWDGGTTWSGPVTLASPGRQLSPSRISLAAEDDDVYVAFDHWMPARHGYVPVYRHSRDMGAAWSARTLLGSGSDCFYETAPVLAVLNGVVRAVFGGCRGQLFYRESHNGDTWSRRETISSDVIPLAPQRAIAVSHRVLVIYDWESPEAERSILVSSRGL